MTKIGKLVKFPINKLDIRKLLPKRMRERPVYDLYAKIDHKGSLFSGHYEATVKSNDNNNWFRYDDSYVVKQNESDLCKANTYILFYQNIAV